MNNVALHSVILQIEHASLVPFGGRGIGRNMRHQSAFLEQTLSALTDCPFTFAIYLVNIPIKQINVSCILNQMLKQISYACRYPLMCVCVHACARALRPITYVFETDPQICAYVFIVTLVFALANQSFNNKNLIQKFEQLSGQRTRFQSRLIDSSPSRVGWFSRESASSSSLTIRPDFLAKVSLINPQ